MAKRFFKENVIEAAQKRIEWTFDNFEKIYISFSGGKDSTIMLHLVMAESRKRNQKIGMMFIDLEGQYKMTIEHVKNCFEMYSDNIDPYWCCLPIHLRNAVSVYETHWIAWEKEREQSWIRSLPDKCISDESFFPFFYHGMEFEDFVPEFGKWYSGGKSCACFVGIRTDESLNRFRSIARRNKSMKDGVQWTTLVTEQVYNVYPIYDMKVGDIWAWHYHNPEYKNNPLYETMHKAGLTPSQMRICQPYGDDQRKGLWLFHLIEPETWSRIVARVNGANSGALYVEESGNINGYRKITKPQGHSWKSFCDLLLHSMPPKTQEHYSNKIILFENWWKERGYPDGIPDEADPRLEAERKVPSYRRVCKSLLRNDYWCKGLSFTQHKSQAYEKYLNLMKRRKEKWKQA